MILPRGCLSVASHLQLLRRVPFLMVRSWKVGLATVLLSVGSSLASSQTGLPTGCTIPPFLEVARLPPTTASPPRADASSTKGAPFLDFQVAAGVPATWRLTGLTSFRGWQEEIERRPETAGPTWFARYRPDLSYRADVDLSGMRYIMAALIEVKPGHGAEFGEMRRLDAASHVTAKADENWAVYEIVLGGPSNAYLMLTPMRSLAYEDDVPPLFLAKIREALGPEGRERLQEIHRLAISHIETTLLRLRPETSQPPAAWRLGNPAFWAR